VGKFWGLGGENSKFFEIETFEGSFSRKKWFVEQICLNYVGNINK
jgi:hypothetical protein